MLNGKYLFIDIGSSETKIVEAVVKQHNIIILKTAEMRDMHNNIDKNGLIHNVELYCLSLKNTIQNAGMKATSAIICSSIFGIQDKDITEQFNGSLKECNLQFNKEYGRTADYSLICDWQHMGDQIEKKTITQRINMSSGSVALLSSFVETFQTVLGVEVLSIESSSTAMTNLNVLFPHSFDMPSLILVDMGMNSMHFKVFKNNVFVSAVDLSYTNGNIYTALAKKFNLVESKVTNLAYNIGMLRTEQNESTLTAGTVNASKYYSFLEEYFSNIIKDIVGQTTSLQNIKNLEDTQVVFMGGLLSLPGVADYVLNSFRDFPRRVLSVESEYTAKVVKIQNKLNTALPTKFNTCIGLMLRNFNEHAVNLVPKEFKLIDPTRWVQLLTKGTSMVLAGILSLLVVFNIIAVIGILTKIDVPDEITAEQSAVTDLNTRVAALKSYTKTLTSINNSLAPFTQFLSSCESSVLKIASVDTAGILAVTTDGETETANDVNNIFNGLVLRGYAATSNDVTTFYEKLKNYEYVSDLSMNGIKEIELSDNDIIYIFEMEVSIKQ